MLFQISRYLFLITTTFFISCQRTFGGTNISEKTYQIVNLSFANVRDSVILGEKTEALLPYYSQISIFRAGKKIYSFSDSTLEFEGFPGRVLTFHRNPDNSWIYIFEVNDRPSFNKYLVLLFDSEKVENLGITQNNSAGIFGDLDLDGYFEIGGIKDYGTKMITVFELRKHFPLDSLLTKKINSR